MRAVGQQAEGLISSTIPPPPLVPTQVDQNVQSYVAPCMVPWKPRKNAEVILC